MKINIKKKDRISFKSVSSKTLLGANIIPLIGVMFFGWTLFSIMFLYWLENVVIGFFNVIRMMKAEGIPPKDIKMNGKPATTAMKGIFIIFFIIHFGIFTAVHGMFVFVLFGSATEPGFSQTIPWSEVASQDISILGITIALIMMIISHGISYRSNYIIKKEYKKISTAEQMFKPYGRVMVMHFVIIIGAFIIMGMGYSVISASILIIIKMLIDLFTHNGEHTKITIRGIESNNLSVNKS